MGRIKYLLMFLFIGTSTIAFGQTELEKIKEDILGKWKHQDKDVTIEFVNEKLLRTIYNADIEDNDDYYIDHVNGKEFILRIKLLIGQYKYNIDLKKDKLILTPLFAKNPKPNVYTRM
ncbi:hypothetical protein [Aureivirga sp. CE67]|uniref:hypothetical protein n=1 Tax=Aureivirga sp. CE67 TaxID=1788983 RepID=UPI0018CB8AF0|nr:hypothetical protein [Aureivirga sp. CE67]